MKFILPFLLFSTIAAAQSFPLKFEKAGEADPDHTHELSWRATPGVRYQVESSTDLTTVDGWSPHKGPITAAGLVAEAGLNSAEEGVWFYRIAQIDDQPPTIVERFPEEGDFAVDRFEELEVELADMTGLDPSSIALTVGTLGTFTLASDSLTLTDGVLIFEHGGDNALGDFGETVAVSLEVADTLGHVVTLDWSFRLLQEPETTENVFVFGSKSALRSGQRLRGPAAVLAARIHGPVRANAGGPDWVIESVTPDTVVLTYPEGNMPEIAMGQLICNHAPAHVDEVFYRRVLASQTDAENRRMTLTTEDAPLSDFIQSGSLTINEKTALLETGADGEVIRASFPLEGRIEFPAIGADYSGSTFGLREDEDYYVAITNAVDQTEVFKHDVGTGEPWLSGELTECSWWLTPAVEARVELDWQGLKAMEASVLGDLEIKVHMEGEATLLQWEENLIPLFDLPEHLESKHVLLLGAVGPVPVYATLGFDLKLKAKARAAAAAEFEAVYRQSADAEFGFTYTRESGISWIDEFRFPEPILYGEVKLEGEFTAEFFAEPQLELLIYGVAGAKAAVRPSAGVTASAHLGTGGSGYNVFAHAGVDLVLGVAGDLFDHIPNPPEDLVYNLWRHEVPILSSGLSFRTHPKSMVVYPGDGAHFSCEVDSPGPPRYQWFHWDTAIPGETGRHLYIPNAIPGTDGEYWVEVSSDGFDPVYSHRATLSLSMDSTLTKDTDRDGVPDAYETGTGIWVSETDRGTKPNQWDTDGDGLSDGVETNTGMYLSNINTGTSPLEVDTDGDGIRDDREIRNGVDPTKTTLVHVTGGREGFSPWIEQNESVSWEPGPGRFLGKSNTGLDSNQSSWGLFAPTLNGMQSVASNVYVFPFGISPGYSVQISMSLGYIADNGTVGFALQTGSGENLFEFYYIGEDPNDSWKINDLEGQENVILSSNNKFLSWGESTWHESKFITVKFTLKDNDSYRLSVSGVPVSNADLNLKSSDLSQLRIFNAGAGSGSDYDQFFNHLILYGDF